MHTAGGGLRGGHDCVPFPVPGPRAGRRPCVGHDLAGARPLHLLPALCGVRPGSRDRQEDLQHQRPRSGCPHRDRCRTRQQDALRTGPRGRGHLSRWNDTRKRGGLRRAHRRGAVRRRIGEGAGTRTSTEAWKGTTSDTNEVASHELPATPLDPELAAKRAGKIKVSMISLCGCWGCSLSLLDIDERMIDLLDKITILRSSFTDIKRIPERCAIGFIEGGVANEDNIETLRHFRDNCDVLISVGACAIWGGVPALRNLVGLKDCLAEAYTNSPTAPPAASPVVPYHHRIPIPPHNGFPGPEGGDIDFFLPGCPPDADAILDVLEDLVNGRPVNLPKSLNRFD